MPGPLQVSCTPQSPAQTPRGQQKILFAFLPSLRNPFSRPRTQTWCWAKTALFYPTSFSSRGQNPFPAFAPGQGGLFRKLHPHGPSLLPAGPKVRTSPGSSCTHIPGSDNRPRGRGPGRRRASERRGAGGEAGKHGAWRSLRLRAERSGQQGSRLRPQGQATLGRQTHEIK